MSKFKTKLIDDLKNGRIILENTNPELTCEIIKAAFSSSNIEATGTASYYERNSDNTNNWIAFKSRDLPPIVSIACSEEFLLEGVSCPSEFNPECGEVVSILTKVTESEGRVFRDKVTFITFVGDQALVTFDYDIGNSDGFCTFAVPAEDIKRYETRVSHAEIAEKYGVKPDQLIITNDED